MILRKNIYLNGFQRKATVYKVAGSNKKEKGYIMIDHDNTGGSLINRKKELSEFGFNERE